MLRLLSRLRTVSAPASAVAVLLVTARAARPEDAAGADDAFSLARREYLSGNYENAERSLRALGRRAHPEAKATLTRLLAETGRPDEAAEVASNLRKARPAEARWAVLAGELEAARGRTKEAETLFIEALKADPGGRRPRVFLRRIYDLAGREEDSERIVDYFWDFNNKTLVLEKTPDPRDFMYVAEVVKDYDAEAKKVAFRHFMRAYKADPDVHEAYVGAGRLALEVYDWARAQREFKALLARNPRHPEGHLGLARVYLAASENRKAEEEAKAALEVNPALAGAHLVLAELHLLDDRMAEARACIDSGLGTNPADPEALALDATWRFASGDEPGFDSAVKKALALYPRHTGLYTGAASILERRRRFPAALEQYRKAKGLDPDGWEGYYGEGMTLVRMGEERAGYAALETAFERNPFNIWAFNTLTALDRDFMEGALARRETEHWVVKITKTEDPVLGEHVEEVLERIWEEETKRFGFTPRGPEETKRKVLFEMFADHDDFSARTAGIPNLGALGATLGQVVTMPSPSWGAGEGKPFCWTEVARHEFAHVITLQLTDYRIPRWFTEGISVHVEGDPQVYWDGLLARAAGEDELVPLSRLNSLFTRPETPMDVALGYYQAALVVEYLVKAYGFECIGKALELYRRGKQTEDVMGAVTGLDAAALDRRVRRYIELHIDRTKAWAPPGPKETERLKTRLAREPGDAAARARLAEGLVASRQYAEARAQAERAIRDYRKAGPARALVVLGLVAKMKDGDDATALAAFKRAVRAEPNDFFARLYLGLARWKSGEDAAVDSLERAHEANPRFTRPVPAFGAPPLAELLLELLKKRGAAERALAVAERASHADPADWRCALFAGAAHLEAGRPGEAKKWLERALSVNPFEAGCQLAFARASEELSRLREGERNLKDAARAFRAATALAERDPEGHRGLARTLFALGRKEEARAAVESLRQFDPAAADRLERELR